MKRSEDRLALLDSMLLKVLKFCRFAVLSGVGNHAKRDTLLFGYTLLTYLTVVILFPFDVFGIFLFIAYVGEKKTELALNRQPKG